MDDSLFIGTSKEIQLAEVLEAASARLNRSGISTLKGNLVALKVENGKETPHEGGLLCTDSYVKLSLQGAATYVSITKFATEVVPGYSVITDPFTIGIGVWHGADPQYRLLAAFVAWAIAVSVGGRIFDSEHKWVDKDSSDPSEFISTVGQRVEPWLRRE